MKLPRLYLGWFILVLFAQYLGPKPFSLEMLIALAIAIGALVAIEIFEARILRAEDRNKIIDLSIQLDSVRTRLNAIENTINLQKAVRR